MASILRSFIKLYVSPNRYYCDKVTTPDDSRILSGNKHKVTDFQKRILVWVKRYKTIEEVPAYLPMEIIEKANSRARIRVCNYMIAATVVACVAMIMSGKKAAEKGETVHQANIEWHKRVKEDAEKRMKEK